MSEQHFVDHVESQPGKQKLVGFSKRGNVHHATPGGKYEFPALLLQSDNATLVSLLAFLTSHY